MDAATLIHIACVVSALLTAIVCAMCVLVKCPHRKLFGAGGWSAVIYIAVLAISAKLDREARTALPMVAERGSRLLAHVSSEAISEVLQVSSLTPGELRAIRASVAHMVEAKRGGVTNGRRDASRDPVPAGVPEKSSQQATRGGEGPTGGC